MWAKSKCVICEKDLGFNGHPLLYMALVNFQHQSVEVNSTPATTEMWVLKGHTIKIDMSTFGPKFWVKKMHGTHIGMIA